MPVALNENGEGFFLDDGGQWQSSQVARNPQTKQVYIYDGKSWVEAQMPSRSLGQMADDTVRSLAQGATFGFADELQAGTEALFGSGTYEQNLANQQKRNAEIPAGIRLPAEIAGGIGATVATAPITGPAAVASGLSRLPGMVRNPAIGTLAGALYGAGEAEPGQRMEGAGKGAMLGAGTGTVAPLAVGAIAKTGSAIRHAVSPQANVATDLGRAIRRDETTPDALLAAARDLERVRPGTATLADAGGENVRGLVERIAQTPGAGRTQIVPALTGRQQQQMGRISTDLRELTGTTRTATQAITETMEARARDARPLYQEAFNFNARAVPEIVQAWTQETSTGFGRSFMLRPEFRRTLQTEYGIQNPADAPLMVQIDVWKKVADDFIRDNIGSNKARVAQAMRDRVLSVVDQANPRYAEARNAWAGPSRYLDAIEEGRGILNTKISADELAAGLANMSEAEREGFRLGAVSAITAKMGADPARMADYTKYLRSPEVREKIAALMPTPEARQQWAERLNFEVRSSELTGRSLGNSATARRLAEREDADNIAGDLVMDAFMGTPPVGLVRRLIGAVPRRVRDTLRARSDEDLADILTDPAAMNRLPSVLRRAGAAGASPSPVRNPAATLGALAGQDDLTDYVRARNRQDMEGAR
jgi:hypothetical protein